MEIFLAKIETNVWILYTDLHFKPWPNIVLSIGFVKTLRNNNKDFMKISKFVFKDVHNKITKHSRSTMINVLKWKEREVV